MPYWHYSFLKKWYISVCGIGIYIKKNYIKKNYRKKAYWKTTGKLYPKTILGSQFQETSKKNAKKTLQKQNLKNNMYCNAAGIFFSANS